MKALQEMQSLLVRSKNMALEMSVSLEEKVKTRTLELEAEVAQRKQAEDTAQAATQVKSNFLTHMSHEIRTPMNAIIGLSELAIRSNPPEKLLDYLNKISYSAAGLLEIINDILDFSKIEAGKMDIESMPFHLEDVIQHLSDIISLKAEEKGLELLFDFGTTVPCYLYGDSLRLGQILINLCNNAIKFTEQGEIVVEVKPVEVLADRIKLQFSIRDTGIGINPTQQKKLFQSFSQADGSTSRKYGGTGLGLVIGKNLVELMQGAIWLESEEGVGSVFLFTVVFDLQEDSKGYSTVNTWHGKRVLIVDGNAASRRILEKTLISFGFQAHAVTPEQLDCDMLFDIILMDWKMAEQIHRHCLTQAALAGIPVIFMATLYASHDMQHAYSDEVDGFLLKPVIPKNLYAVLYKVLNGDDMTDADKPLAQTPEIIQSIEGAEILLVDDNELNVQIATEFLHQAGMRVTVAHNGREAVAAASTTFDGICMDIQMPEMDGYEATRLIRERYSEEQLPIIAMTAHTMVGQREKCLAAGMNDFVGKPIDHNQLFSVLRKWITPDRLKKPDQTQQPPKFDVTVTGLDVNQALQRVGGKQTVLYTLLSSFEKRYGHTTDALRSALAAEDLDKVYRVSHTLKGLAGSFAAQRLHDICRELEMLSQAGDTAKLALLLDAFAQALAEVMQAIGTLKPFLAPAQVTGQVIPLTSQADLTLLLAGLNTQLEKGDSEAKEAIGEITRVLPERLQTQLQTMVEHIEAYDFEDAHSVLLEITEALALDLSERG